jgi:APA family basic amino acid/polyamine antiporter
VILLKQLFKTKSFDAIIHESEEPGKQLKRTLTAFDVTLLGIGAIVGAGIFATIGTAAAGDALRPGAGPALMLSFVLTGIACGFAALCYAEFAAMVPISGSAYTYSYGTLGELIAWIIGWDLIIEYAVGNVAVAISWANYFKTLVAGFGVIIPDWMSTDYRTAAKIPGLFENAPHIFGVPLVFNVPAVSIVALITIVLVIGIKESARFNAIMVIIKLLILGFFIYICAHYVKPENWTPFAPNGWSGIQAGAAVVFFAYIGFDAVSTVAEEVKNPKRDLPIGIIGSLIICTILYIAVAAVFTGIIPYQVLVKMLATQQAEPLTMAVQYANIEKNKDLFVGIIAFGSVIAHTAVLLVFQMGQPRIFFSMARDGLLPQKFAEVHPKFRTPYFATILTGLVVGVTSMFTSIDEMVDLTNIGTLFAFVLVCIGIIILRKKEPDRPRSFRVPFVPVVPLLGVAACLYLMMGLPWITWIRFAGWLIVGMMVYRSYGFKHSKLKV